jgi:hypothetical protein
VHLLPPGDSPQWPGPIFTEARHNVAVKAMRPTACALARIHPQPIQGIFMNKLLSVLALGITLACGHAYATPQQEKMKTCNADAKTKNLAGDERKAFMKECLSNKPAAPADGKTAQQNKMKTCNGDAKAKALKGDERKAFMSSCLKG